MGEPNPGRELWSGLSGLHPSPTHSLGAGERRLYVAPALLCSMCFMDLLPEATDNGMIGKRQRKRPRCKEQDLVYCIRLWPQKHVDHLRIPEACLSDLFHPMEGDRRGLAEVTHYEDRGRR